MATHNITTCDRCGKATDSLAANRLIREKVKFAFWTGERYQTDGYDLCPKCSMKLDRFMKGAKTNA